MIGRTAGVDYGRRRIGLAVSDPLGIAIRGLETVHHPGGLEAAVERTAEALAPLEAVRLVVGLPLHAHGAPSPMSREAQAFGDALGARLGLPVVYVDEGLTSWEAEERLRGRGGSRRERQQRGDVDREAARTLLAGWLAEEARLREAEPGTDRPPPPDPER